MQNARKMKTTPTPPAHARAETIGAAWSGYTDKLAGRGFSREYETECNNFQHNYERGRLWATAMTSTGTVVPWKSPARVPANFLDIAYRAASAGDIPAI